MKINKHNLEIAKHCAKEAFNGWALNVLHFTKTGTFAANRFFAIAVTALSVDADDIDGVVMSQFESLAIEHETGSQEICTLVLDPPSTGEFPDVSKYHTAPAEFEIMMDSALILELAQAVVDFGAEIVKIKFSAKNEPARWEARNKDGQTFSALLMPRSKDACKECGCKVVGGICQNYGCEGRVAT